MFKTLLKLIIIAVTFPAFAGTSTVISNAPLHQNPSIQSSVLTTLSTGTKVETIKRKGGWKLIKTINKLPKFGWIRSYKVRQGNITIVNAQKSSGGFFSGLASLSRKASGLFSSKKKDYSFQNTATIGIRGLSEEEIKNAQPDLKQLALLDTYQSSKNTSINFAKQGGRKALALKHLAISAEEK